MSTRPRPVLSLRALLLGLAAVIGATVVGLGAYVALTLGPSARGLRTRAVAMAAEYDSLRTQTQRLRDAFQQVRALTGNGRPAPLDPGTVRTLRATLVAAASRSVAVQASLLLSDVPVSMRLALADAAGTESHLAGILVEALQDLESGDRRSAQAWLARAESVRAVLSGQLDTAEQAGFANLAARERVLGERARRVGQGVVVWVVLGFGLVGLAILVVQRRLYVPLAALEEGLGRVARGDLETTVRVRRDDELGRLASHFNEMTAVLRARPEVEALRASETRFRTAFMTGTDAYLIAGRDDGRILEANDQLLAMYGYRREEVIGRSSHELGMWVHPEARRELLARLAAEGLVRNFEVLARRKSGETFPVLYSAAELGGEPPLLMGVLRDVSEQKRSAEALRSLEEQFRQAQRLEAVGRLAGGVAHDFNNILTAITGYTDLLLDDFRSNDPRRADLVEIRAAAERATGLTRQLLAFSRKQVLQPRVLDLNDVILGLEKMLHRLIGEDVKLVFTPGRDLWPVRADPGQIEQVLLNLAVNARDAMPDGGHLTIETANVELGEAYAREHAGAAAGPCVLLAVSDTGTGMDRETQAHLFEPFFTTKELGKGTGLGLATVHGIVAQSGGRVEVYSEPGHGTSFKIYLPRCAEAASAAAPAPVARPSTGGRETVLVAEDDRAVRELVSSTLAERGYRVLRAPDGQTALELAVGAGERVHLLLTDVVMPGMTGRALGEALKARQPDLRVLYVSGYSEDAVLRHGILQDGMPFLQKPFTPEALARMVRDVLDGKATGR